MHDDQRQAGSDGRGPKRRKISAVIRDAADVIERNGLSFEALHGGDPTKDITAFEDVPLCTLGALNYVTTGHPFRFDEVRTEAVEYLAGWIHLDPGDTEPDADSEDRLSDWNDIRTVDEVASALRQAAQEAEDVGR